MKTSALYLLFCLHYTHQWCLQSRTYFSVLSVATHLHIYFRVYHVRNSRQEPKGKNWIKEHEEKCLLDCSSMISSACLLIQTCLLVVPPTVIWAHLSIKKQSTIKKMSHRHTYREIWCKQFLNWCSLFPNDYILCQVDRDYPAHLTPC